MKMTGLSHLGTLPFGKALELETYELDNGLRILLLPDRKAQVVAYHTWFRVGSRHEKVGKTGIAHLFEHLMFNETENLPKGEFDRRLEEAGAEANASTWLDFTQYNISAPSSELDLLIEVESERMEHLVLREPQLDSEKEVVMNERRYRVEDDVEGAVNELLWSTAFTVHPYRWPTIGWMEDIAGFTTDDCREFYGAYYSPNNASLVVVGDFDRDELLGKLVRAYGGFERATIPTSTYEAEPAQLSGRSVEVRKPTPTEKLAIGYRSPSLLDPDHVPLSLLCEVLAGGRASRLHKRLVRELELCSDIRISLGPFHDPGLLDLWASAREGVAGERVLEVIDEEVSRLLKSPPELAELERAKARAELGLLHGLENADGKAQTIGFYDCVLGEPAAAFQRMDSLLAVSQDDVFEVGKKYLHDRSRTVIQVRPSIEEVAQ
jgi:zinc protease